MGALVQDGDPGGNLSSLREQNLRRVIGALLSHKPGLTQPEIVERTGLSRSTVAALIADLEAILLHENVKTGSDRGRPVKSWRIDASAAFSIGIDVGETHITVAVTNPFGEIVAGPITESIDGVLDEPHQTLSLATHMVESLTCAAQEPVPCADIAAVTVGLPGPVDSATGIMADEATRAWAGIDVREEIRKRWPHEMVPARLADNNANLGAIAEHRFGAGLGAESLLFIKWSSGIGSGLILENKLWRGRSGVAGELGHLHSDISRTEADTLRLPVDRESWQRCERCNQLDCLERVAGGRRVAEAVGLPNLSKVVEAALAGPESAKSEQGRKVLKTAANLIGRAIGPTLTLLDVQRVIVGGVVGDPALYPMLVEELNEGMRQTALPRALSDASLEIGALNRDAPVRGAAIAGFDAFGIGYLMAKAAGREPPQRTFRGAGTPALTPT